MTTGRLFIVALLLSALAMGAGMYWLQVYAFYRELPPEEVYAFWGPPGPNAARLVEGITDFQGIDAESSPIRYRACFRVEPGVAENFIEYEEPRPPVAPDWFNCFDASAIGDALEAGEARAVLGTPDVQYGIDRVVAVLPDGRAFAWNQINACGEVVFDGEPAPEGCPPVPESLN